MKKTIFGGGIRPACAYCRFGERLADTGNVNCVRQGVVAEDYKCRHFVYDPLRRIPPRKPKLLEYSEKEFQL